MTHTVAFLTVQSVDLDEAYYTGNIYIFFTIQEVRKPYLRNGNEFCFHPGKLRTKPDTLTRQWDIYLKEGNSDYATVNPQN